MKSGHIKKNILYVLTLVCLLCLVACADKEDVEGKRVDLAALQTAMLESDTKLPEMTVITDKDEDAKRNFAILSDLEYDRVDEYFYAYAKDGSAEEIAVIHLKDSEDAAVAMQKLHDHVDKRIGTFREYSPDYVQMLEKAVVTRSGGYVTMIVSSQNGLVQETFKSFFE